MHEHVRRRSHGGHTWQVVTRCNAGTRQESGGHTWQGGGHTLPCMNTSGAGVMMSHVAGWPQAAMHEHVRVRSHGGHTWQGGGGRVR